MCMTGQTIRSQDVRFPTITLPRTNDRHVPILSVCRSEVCAVRAVEHASGSERTLKLQARGSQGVFPMNYYGAKDLATAFVLCERTRSSLPRKSPRSTNGFRAAPETRTVAQLLTHIAVVERTPEQIHSIERRTTLEGFDFPEFIRSIVAEEQRPQQGTDHHPSSRRRGAMGKVAGKPIRRISRGACQGSVRHDAADQNPL